MAVKSYFVGPQDGWVNILNTDAKASLRVSSFPHTHPFYIYGAPSGNPTSVAAAATGSFTFSGGIPTNAQTVAIGSETYTFKTTPTGSKDVQIHAATPGTGTVTFSGLSVATQTVVIGTETWTFVASGASGFNVNVGTDANTSAANFATAVNGNSLLITAVATLGVVTVTSILNTVAANYTYSTSATHVTVGGAAMTGGQDGSLITATSFTSVVNAHSTLVLASDTTGVVTLTAVAVGTQGNYALTTSATHVARSGALMTGGTQSTTGILVCHKPFRVRNFTAAGNVEAFWVRVTNTSNQNSSGDARIDVYTDGGTLI